MPKCLEYSYNKVCRRDTHWLASMSGSSHDDKVPHTCGGHSGVSSRRSKDTCAPCPRKGFIFIYKIISILLSINKINNNEKLSTFTDEMVSEISFQTIMGGGVGGDADETGWS